MNRIRIQQLTLLETVKSISKLIYLGSGTTCGPGNWDGGVEQIIWGTANIEEFKGVSILVDVPFRYWWLPALRESPDVTGAFRRQLLCRSLSSISVALLALSSSVPPKLQTPARMFADSADRTWMIDDQDQVRKKYPGSEPSVRWSLLRHSVA